MCLFLWNDGQYGLSNRFSSKIFTVALQSFTRVQKSLKCPKCSRQEQLSEENASTKPRGKALLIPLNGDISKLNGNSSERVGEDIFTACLLRSGRKHFLNFVSITVLWELCFWRPVLYRLLSSLSSAKGTLTNSQVPFRFSQTS